MNEAHSEGEKTIVIVGGGVAGVMAADAAREESPTARIVLIHDEPGLPYNRLNLTRMIAGEISHDELELNPGSWYSENRIEHIHCSVVSVDRDARKLALSSGSEVPYDTLVLATGANPFVPPIPGANLAGVSPLRTIAHADEILATVSEGTRCICIGGGLLGLELAAGLSKRGGHVTVLENSGWILSRQLAPGASAILRRKMEEMGLTILCGAKASKIMGEGKVSGVLLESGEELPAEMVLISTGVRPNTELAKNCGLEVGRGLKVDDRMNTGDPAIFAAGDVTEHRGVVYGLWPTAMEQGRVAGANAAGGQAEFKGMAPSAFLKVVGVDVFSVGDFLPKEGTANVIEKEENGNYIRLAVREGKLIGGNLVGDISAAMAVKSAVAKAMPIRDNARLLKLFPELAEFSQ